MLFPLPKKTLFTVLSVLFSAFMMSEVAYSYSHNLINTARSSWQRNIYVTQAIEAEFGHYSSGNSEGQEVKQAWNGYGFRNAIGIELMKFIQFSAHHTFLNMSNRDSSSERLNGSRLAGEVKFSFASPMGNLEMGAGALVSRYDLQRKLEHTSVVGNGMYYTVGLNYFVSSQVSIFGNVKQINENFNRNGGAALESGMKASTTSAGIGASIWL